MNQTHWCTCEGHNTGDFIRTTDFYASYFQPTGWALEYDTLLEEAIEERTLYLTGQCGLCFNRMRTGMTLPINHGGDALLAHIWMALETYRPFASRNAGTWEYTRCPPARRNWYQRQDRLSTEEKETRFVSLFHDADKEVAERWLEQRRAIPHAVDLDAFIGDAHSCVHADPVAIRQLITGYFSAEDVYTAPGTWQHPAGAFHGSAGGPC